MPPKKKKTQLKPMARGFATTSQPKKIVKEDAVETKSTTSVLSLNNIHSESHADPVSNREPEVAASEINTDLVEEQSLQNLVDKLQDKTEKEIIRSIKAIETEKRFAQTLPRLDFDSSFVDRILHLACSTESRAARTNDDVEKVIARLGITYGVLRRLGYSECVVEKCLRNLTTFDLEDAFDWLYMNCSELELESGCAHDDDYNTTTDTFEGEFKRPETEMLKLSAGVSLQRYSTPPATPLTQSAPSSRLRKPAEPRSPVLPSRDGISRVAPFFVGLPVVNSQVISEFEKDAALDNLDSADPATVFARLKLLHDVTSIKEGATERLQALRKQMDTISKDYLFDAKEAGVLYNQERDRLREKLLEERLLSYSLAPTPAPNDATSVTPVTDPDTTNPGNDSDSDDSSTGMLGILDNPDANEITVKGVTISFRTMVLPKHWSGPMPKGLLRDFMVKQDRYAAVSYSMLSTHTRARRASVTISWQNKRRDEWLMEDVACPDDSQAENYVATVALHSLTYPMKDGFASPMPASSGSSTSFRLLPASYRELWEELEAARRRNEDRINRNTWAKLRAVVEDKTIVKKTCDKQTKQISEKELPSRPQPTHENANAIDPMAGFFQARKSTPYFESILAQRNELPISQYRNEILLLLKNSQVLVLSGETGCGKSTQVPSFILEHHLSQGKSCKIICTEPRRISAISLAQRVSYELCDPPNSVGGSNSLVGYSIRLESNISRSTRLAFVTNGIALRMLESGSGPGGQGTALDDITHIVVDEVHERTIESDFLLIVLKKLLAGKPELKVILMSATMDADKISAYFDNCPTLHVPGRTFPVTIQYLEDAIEYAQWTISESSPYARRWSDKFYKGKNRPEWTEEVATLDDDDDEANPSEGQNFKLEKRYSHETTATLNMLDERLIPYDLIIRLIEKICFEDSNYKIFSAAILIFVPGLGEIRRLTDMLAEHPLLGSNDFRLYPLHSTLSSESQSAVFDIPHPGVRKIVIATNIAETGITIPDITCVIDTGKHREMRFDEKRQLSRLVETGIAKSNASQRRGRAGRVQHGLCFHLFTKLRHETQMAESPLPEMMRLSLSDLALKIKILNVKLGSSIGEVLSRALDPPMAINIQRAVSMLVEVNALTPSEDITPMGRLLSKLPTDVHLGKFLLISTVFRCLDPALTIAATLNSKSPFVIPLGLEQDADRAKSSFRTDNSDFMTIHNAFASWRRACSNPGFARKFCRANFMSHQNLQQIEDLRQQFLGYLIDSSFIQVDKSVLRELSRARYARNKTRFVAIPPEFDTNSNNPVLVHAALAAGLYPKILSVNKNSELRTITNNQHAFFHPTSVNFGRNPTEFGVNYLSYFTLMHSKKLYAWETGPVDDLSLVLLCGDAEHKLASDIVSIDRKIKMCVCPRTNLALKILREQLGNLLAHQYESKPLGDIQNSWKDIGLLAVGRMKIKPDDNPQLAK